jgi:hypothetical protein
MRDPARAYQGYLSPYVDRIRAMYLAGASTHEIAEALYKLGARASTSEPSVPHYRMRRAHHVANLRLMALYTLQRLGLRTRRKRTPRWSKSPSVTSHDQV